MTRLLYIDDERTISGMVAEYLAAKDFHITLIHNAIDGFEAFKKGGFDLCILDVKMPFKDGYTLAKEIREFNEDIPIIFLTANTEKEDRIKGLSLGADDYITKPFSMEELYLRIKNILKRIGYQEKARKENSSYQLGRFIFDANARTLEKVDNTIKLTAIEAQLLKMFCESPDGVIERELALKRIWNDDALLHGRSLNVYVSKLRQYLSADPAIEIMNVHGSGYKMLIG